MTGERARRRTPRTGRDLELLLEDIDRRGYPAYKRLAGRYELDGIALTVAHVQGDPFAAPSALEVEAPPRSTGLPRDLLDRPERRVAVEDLLVRRLARELARVSGRVGGSGRSGVVAGARPGPEVLPRSACEVFAEGGVVFRFTAGLPAHGRTVDGRAAAHLLLDLVPEAVWRALPEGERDLQRVRDAVELADDRAAARRALGERGLIAFVADGSVLPRSSGVSSRPLEGARPFASPEELAVEIELPHRGTVRGMGIRRGVTLIVGGGYHGKSTLLKALEEGVYDHVAGDGRELVVCDAGAVKVRAEDGRSVHEVDISPFVRDLPDGRDTRAFSTADASGSTSQAASTVEAIAAGARTLLIDEDTSATNFMVRDALMEEVVARGSEPITPFVERVRALWEGAGVSSVIVVGSSGAFFPAADTVIQMDRYRALDITERVRGVCRAHGLAAPSAPDGAPVGACDRPIRIATPAGEGRDRSGRPRPPRLRTAGLNGFSLGSGSVDVRLVEQLVDPDQVEALALMVRLAFDRGLLDGDMTPGEVAGEVLRVLRDGGWRALAGGAVPCDLALPRASELCACLNRWRDR